MSKIFGVLFLGMLNIPPLIAASLKVTADRLGQETTKIGVALGVFALAIAGTYLAMGKQEGNARVNQAIIGIVIILAAPAIVKLIKSII